MLTLKCELGGVWTCPHSTLHTPPSSWPKDGEGSSYKSQAALPLDFYKRGSLI